MILRDKAPVARVDSYLDPVSHAILQAYPARVHRKAFKYRLYPNKEQKLLLDKHLSICRAIYNIMLHQAQEAYEAFREGKSAIKLGVSAFDFNRRLTELKRLPMYAWLNDISAVALQQKSTEFIDHDIAVYLLTQIAVIFIAEFALKQP